MCSPDSRLQLQDAVEHDGQRMQTLTPGPQGPSCLSLSLLLHWTLSMSQVSVTDSDHRCRFHLHTGLGLAVTVLLPLHGLLSGQLELVSQHLREDIMIWL